MSEIAENGEPEHEVSLEQENHQYEAFKSWKWSAFQNRRQFFTIMINVLLILGFSSRIQYSLLSLAGEFESKGEKKSGKWNAGYTRYQMLLEVDIPNFEIIDLCLCTICVMVCFRNLSINLFSVIKVTAHPSSFTLMLVFLPTSILSWLNVLAFYKVDQIGVDEKADFLAINFVSMITFHNLGAPQIWTDAMTFQSVIMCMFQMLTGHTMPFLSIEYACALYTVYNIVRCQDYELFRNFLIDRKRKKLAIDSDMVLALDKLHSKMIELRDEMQVNPPPYDEQKHANS